MQRVAVLDPAHLRVRPADGRADFLQRQSGTESTVVELLADPDEITGDLHASSIDALFSSWHAIRVARGAYPRD